tara:strand:- start:361 stop:489 length:129 start_codon:yes stop_codon:yes gene_type:complete
MTAMGIVVQKKKEVFEDLLNSDVKNYPITLLSSDANYSWVVN